MTRIAAIGFGVLVVGMVALAILSGRAPEPGPEAADLHLPQAAAPAAGASETAAPSAAAPAASRPTGATARAGDTRPQPGDASGVPRVDGRSGEPVRAASSGPRTASESPSAPPREAPPRVAPRIDTTSTSPPPPAAEPDTADPLPVASGAPPDRPAPADAGDPGSDRALQEAMARRSLGEDATEKEIRDRADFADTLLSGLDPEERQRVEERFGRD